MNVVVDALNVVTGWSGTGSVAVEGLNEVVDYIAGDQDASLVYSFPAGSLGESISKSMSVDVSAYDQLVLSVWSRNKRCGDYKKFNDCPYTLILNGTEEYGIRCWNSFTEETVDISGIDTITSVAFKAKHDDEDYLLVSFMVASFDELPADLFDALQDKIEEVRNESYPLGLEVGTVVTSSGDESINITGSLGLLWRYTVITIVEGVNSETHQLSDLGAGGYELTSLFDGKSIINTFSAGKVYVQFPVNVYQTEKEIMFPAFTIYGMEPVPVDRGTKEDRTQFSFTAAGFEEVEQDHIMEWNCNIDIASRSLELNAVMAFWLRKLLYRHVLWVNGRKFTTKFSIGAVEELPNDSFDVIPKLAYTVTIEVKEKAWQTSRPISLPATTTFQPMTTL